MPARIAGKPGRVYAYAVLDDTNHTKDEILVGTERDDDETGRFLARRTGKPCRM